MAHYKYNYNGEWIKTGVTFGSVLSIVISFTMNHSVFWAIIHGFMSWFYVIYYILVY
ncbi:MAG: hypothetical protein HN657_00150 [Candidatus Marinimicrobia bacterium]|jgi:hypothetical protein|nr:hypothetical protein [Candidatus Neomarinimicrobiota bacterium]MBT3496570.1 hypothetical protein [Candidatus Neomarinimicrobiota bacterium]MBT3692368.1 hypothetical protein [Candidatus Neomarinimicrobiota bacterium]MBT3732549.1 hypothetical protein [Candidatus Neomarinimicrobiota bacterium]MBT4145126.1 hypothetical protein [Candidatus Neomarinimicrobiota bacterium]